MLSHKDSNLPDIHIENHDDIAQSSQRKSLLKNQTPTDKLNKALSNTSQFRTQSTQHTAGLLTPLTPLYSSSNSTTAIPKSRFLLQHQCSWESKSDDQNFSQSNDNGFGREMDHLLINIPTPSTPSIFFNGKDEKHLQFQVGEANRRINRGLSNVLNVSIESSHLNLMGQNTLKFDNVVSETPSKRNSQIERPVIEIIPLNVIQVLDVQSPQRSIHRTSLEHIDAIHEQQRRSSRALSQDLNNNNEINEVDEDLEAGDNVIQVNTPQANALNEVLPEIEAKFFLQKNILFFVYLSLISGYLLLMINKGLHFQGLFIISYLYLLSCIAFSIIRTYFEGRENWRIREDAFSIIDLLTLSIFIASVNLRFMDLMTFGMANFVPFIATTLAYMVLSSAPSLTKKTRIFIRTMQVIQLILVTLKLHDSLDCEWIFVFGMFWIYLGIVAIYLIAYAAILILSTIYFLVQMLLRANTEELQEFKLQFSGLLWHFCYYGLGIIAVLMLIGIHEAYGTTQDARRLQFAAISSLCINSFLAVYSLLTFKPLVVYIKLYSLADGALFGSDSAPLEDEAGVKMNVEKKESYFVRMSSTYFRPLSMGLLSKNEEKLRQLKTMITDYRKDKLKKNKTSYDLHRFEKPINIQTLKQDKQILDEKLTKIARGEIDAQFKRTTGKPKLSLIILNSDHKRTEGSPLKVRVKGGNYLSVDDLEGLKTFKPKENKEEAIQEENLCYLCCIEEPNAVLMGCGHGGICYGCAVILMTKQNKCMECRGKVSEIYKVDPNPKLSDVIKGIEICKVVSGPTESQEENDS